MKGKILLFIKVLFIVILGLTILNLVGCQASSSSNNEVSTSNEQLTPEQVVQRFIEGIVTKRYSQSWETYTEDKKARAISFDKFVQRYRENDVDTSEYNSEPYAKKEEPEYTGLWYDFRGDYKFYELIKENGEWKISNFDIWYTDQMGDPLEAAQK